MQLTASCAKALSPCSHQDTVCTVSVCKVPGADNEGTLPVDSLLKKVPSHSGVASEVYCGNGTHIIQTVILLDSILQQENVPPLLSDLLIRLANLSKEGKMEI